MRVAVWQETIGTTSFEYDLCINSPTRSEKTLAYALPIVQTLSSREIKCVRALVVLSTRDLPVKEVFASLVLAMGLSVGLAIGESLIVNEISNLIKKPTSEADIYFDVRRFLIGLEKFSGHIGSNTKKANGQYLQYEGFYA
ncbi:DEAD-box ATP-dependent RNA helicase 1 [Olea europaea subsp. europaea]|uniref:DEAD-box ATP-dependent RNA helicase 1 n=1 Tax=Olea europaea subsp. europaea TaxID=158383 RepID=A0A8S0SAM3_OLEEU|nr:DEAD-box ATP-dependent RNA helicase 1 [Olea europaea subsp. europaea]